MAGDGGLFLSYFAIAKLLITLVTQRYHLCEILINNSQSLVNSLVVSYLTVLISNIFSRFLYILIINNDIVWATPPSPNYIFFFFFNALYTPNSLLLCGDVTKSYYYWKIGLPNYIMKYPDTSISIHTCVIIIILFFLNRLDKFQGRKR